MRSNYDCNKGTNNKSNYNFHDTYDSRSIDNRVTILPMKKEVTHNQSITIESTVLVIRSIDNPRVTPQL